MDFVHSISRLYGISPFDILDEDAEKVFMMIEYFSEKSENEPINKSDFNSTDEIEYRKVNDQTATGGWF